MRSLAKTITASDISRCPFLILAPEHYREDGSCRCDDRTHLAMHAWGYSWGRVRVDGKLVNRWRAPKAKR